MCPRCQLQEPQFSEKSQVLGIPQRNEAVPQDSATRDRPPSRCSPLTFCPPSLVPRYPSVILRPARVATDPRGLDSECQPSIDRLTEPTNGT